MKKAIWILAGLAITLLCSQCKNNQSNSGENNKIILDSLRDECRKAVYTPGLLKIAKEMEREALKQKNDSMIGSAYSFMSGYYQKTGIETFDSVRLYAEKAKEYFIKGGQPNRALRLEASVVGWEIYMGKKEGNLVRIFDLIKKCEDLKDYKAIIDAYNLLGTIYIVLDNPKETLNTSQIALQYIRTMDDQDTKAQTNYYIKVFLRLTQAASSIKNYDLALTYSDSMKYYVNKRLIGDTSPVAKEWSIVYEEQRVSVLLKMNKVKEAFPFIQKLLLYRDNNLIGEKTPRYYQTLGTLSTYYLKIGEYSKALELIDEVIEYNKSSSSYDNLNIAKNKKADILAAKGKYKEAFQMKSDMLTFIEDVNMENASRQLSELYTIYNVDKLEKQSLEDKAKARYSLMVIIFMGIVCFLLIAITLTIRRNLRKLKKKNEKIVAQYQEMDKYRQQIKGLALIKEGESASSAKESTLFEKTEEYLLNTHCYKDPDISRESLAIQIGTNRQYLTQAIQDSVNMTFSEYINNYRLEYARLMLSENINIPIEKIYTSAGFVNKSTFYRLFKQKYDMTPKEFREISCMTTHTI
ncbi:AraC-like DNA-binding protein [Dysgonomonas sp. PFB1-18]|uniref:helix-turn-helix domain-containing protein n=1 Tax=unclassified Dysgonomonas TaxID=2630389 RepID=UPI002473DBCC|nr:MULTISPECIES: helix-turn-helix domain-containing protein [unclassified Dysgonomonas]MDH6310137.1 AraC-like DNA-binding protein [Dysgonomonas sp. PF1-14]MDH6340197.1 AraC-like DNA-binding protein [Dysgonomonas sp. PF1-16]MDH6381694.1 AraC-like DNA-binding protein [Dysgonomonas sp. PFB1-18]MDH6399053.1 AraC-like DNA-binding protein [Dysgonomonas sp. PF1-23]